MAVPVPSPDPPGPLVPEGVRLAMSAVLAAALVLALLVVLTRESRATDTTETASGELTSSSAGPGGTFTDAPTPPDSESVDPGSAAGAGGAPQPIGGCPEGTIAEVCDAVGFIEAFKGNRPFLTFPTVNFIDGDAFDAFVLADFAEVEAELRDTGDTLASLGLIDADVDLVEALRTTLELGVVGAYNHETKELNVNGTEVNLYTQMVMVHELTHAWDDQYFHLTRPDYDDRDDEVASGFLNVVEGSATLTQNAWRDQLSAEQSSQLDALELGVIAPEDLDRLLAVPMFVLQLQASPYTDGASFVQMIYDEGGIEAVDALFDSPPTTTEQVFHVDAYLDAEPAATVPDVVPDEAVFDEGVLGEATFALWFGPEVGDGWGGDRYTSWRTADRVCTAVSVVADTPTDTDEFRTALDAWATAAPTGATRTLESTDGTITATGCI